MATQCELILDHLKNHGSISHAEAESQYGCTRLAARINDLRRLGVSIRRVTVKGRNRRGQTTHYARYYIGEVDKMILDDAVEVIKPDPDGQYRLVRCKCGSDNVAYVLGADGKWRARCFDCGHTGEKARVRHDAQVRWNRGVRS